VVSSQWLVVRVFSLFTVHCLLFTVYLMERIIYEFKRTAR
jgi:hypothetical protein